MPARFIITDYSHTWLDGVLYITIITDITCHVHLKWTDKETHVHLKTELDRGLLKLGDPYYCFVEFTIVDQNEPGDTFTHTFTWPGWATCYRRWYTFQATVAGIASPSNVPLFNVHYQDPPVFTLGEYLDPIALHGWVKLEAGAGIDIATDIPHNSLKIKAL